MPYRKPYRKRRFKRRRTYGRKKMSLSRRMTKMYKVCKPETKYITDTSDNVEITTWSVSDALPPVSQGVEDAARIGGKIYARRLMFNLHVEVNSANSSKFANIRFIIGKYQGANLPSAADIISGDDSILNHWEPNKAGQFHIMADRLVLCGTQGNAQQIKYFKVNVALNRNVIFEGNSDTRGNTFRYFILCRSDQSSDGPFLTFDCRLVYTDA